jgi:hypothetical protein
LKEKIIFFEKEKSAKYCEGRRVRAKDKTNESLAISVYRACDTGGLLSGGGGAIG